MTKNIEDILRDARLLMLEYQREKEELENDGRGEFEIYSKIIASLDESCRALNASKNLINYYQGAFQK